MRTNICFLVALISVTFFGTTISLADSAKGKVLSVSGDAVELDVGSDQGVASGDAGRIYYTIKFGNEDKALFVARIRVVSVTTSTSKARIEEKTGKVRPDHFAEIMVRQVAGGDLEIRSDPTGAQVYLSGKNTGETPLTVRGLRPGQYQVRVLKEEYDPYEVSVEVLGSKQKGVLAYLEKARREGELVVSSDPSGATVFLGGQSVGVSPYEGKALSPAQYKVRVEKEGYETWEREVPVESGKMFEVLAKLKKLSPGPTAGQVWKDPTTGIEFVFVKGGCYEMGDTFGPDASDEQPVHEACVDDYWMGKYEVTQGQWERVMNSNPSSFKGDDKLPVEQVSWSNVQVFIEKLNQRSGKRYRLPTEAEWEYAARSGGKREKWAGTSNEGELGEYAWYSSNSVSRTHPVGQKKPNGLGLYDMSGNVWEWCQDWYDSGYYGKSPRNNPLGPDSGQVRVVRGGSWLIFPRLIRASIRIWVGPSDRFNNIGFRLVLPIQ